MTEPTPEDSVAFRERLATARRIWQERLQAFPLAHSTDGRTFSYHAPLTYDLSTGGYLRIQIANGAAYLGQVVSKEIATLQGPSIQVAGDAAQSEDAGAVSHMSFRIDIRRIEGTGNLLGRLEDGVLRPTGRDDRFEGASLAPASEDDVALFLAGRLARRARLDIGRVVHGSGSARALLDAAGFNRHTFMCGQSGSGKTYSLGVVLERILTETELRLVILDPNSDFVRLAEMRPADGASDDPTLADLRARYEQVRDRIRVLRPGSPSVTDRESLRIRFSDLDRTEQGLVLGLDPIRDRREFDALRSVVERLGTDRYDLHMILQATRMEFSDEMRELGLRISNLGVAGWDVWADVDQSSLTELDDDWRALVLDIGGFGDQAEKSVVAMAVLGRLWRTRERRQPLLIVVDEAHNVCPATAGDALQAVATDHVIRIAAEGRKYGLYLLVSSQRPDKLDRNVLSQCDNLLLMRMNAANDVGNLASLFSFVPVSLLAQATGFSQGESLVAGKIAPSPILVRFGTRISPEGGSDVPTTWAAPRE